MSWFPIPTGLPSVPADHLAKACPPTLSFDTEGPEIPDKISDRLFDPMFSYGKTNAKHSHLGLGLFVVRLIAEYHQGTAWAENRIDHTGVGVTVSIPMNGAQTV